MNRREFMKRLEELLSDVSYEERQEALSFYESYFEDAGVEKEPDIVAELESPEKVAITIKKDLFGENYNAEAYAAKQRAEEERKRAEEKQRELNNEAHKNKVLRNLLIALAVIITFPIWIGVMGALFGILVGLLGCIFAFAVGGAALVGAMLLAGVVLLVVAVVKTCTGFLGSGFILIAVSLVLLVFGLLGLLAMVWIFGKFVPWLIRGIVTGIQKLIFHGRKGAQQL